MKLMFLLLLSKDKESFQEYYSLLKNQASHNFILKQSKSDIFPIVPDTAPTITMAVRTSTTTAVIKWKPLSLKESGGFITGYNAIILESSDEECVTTTDVREIDTADIQILLYELEPFKVYCISLAGRTTKGIGKYSNISSIPCKN